MSLSMYQASIPVLVRSLRILSDLLAKGEAFAREQGIDPQEMLDLRLAADMFPLGRQVQIASDGAKGGAARLAGIEAPSLPDTETTFAQLQERLAKTIGFLESIPADKIDGSEDRAITMKAGTEELKSTGQSHLLAFVLPNVFFHVTTAYALLRQKGVQIGKLDFLGGRNALQ
jgi:hypothetical protein